MSADPANEEEALYGLGTYARRLRDSGAVEVAGDIAFQIDNKADFQVEANLKPVFEALKEKGLNPEMRKDEAQEAAAKKVSPSGAHAQPA